MAVCWLRLPLTLRLLFGFVWSASLLVFQVNLDLVIHAVRPVLLVLGHRRLPLHHMHLHLPWQEQLLLLVLQVDALDAATIGAHVHTHQVVLHLYWVPTMLIH